MSVDEWYNTIQTQINLAKYPAETAKILHRDIFWFFLRDEEFVSKTINDSNINLEKCSASKVRQLAKRLESSKSTARHIRKMSSEPQAAQVNLLRHQRTEISPNRAQRKWFRKNKFRPKTWGTQMKITIKHLTRKMNMKTRRYFNQRQILQSEDKCHKCGASKHIEGFQCSARKYQCGNCHNFGHFNSLCYKKQESYKKRPRSPKAYQLTSSRLSAQDKSIYTNPSDNSSSEDELFCLQMKVQAIQANEKYPTPKHLFTSLEFKVKLHKNKTKFLWTRIDTCADVNIMPVSIYKYLFKDPDCGKIAPNVLQLGTYTNKKVKIIGSCNLYIIHSDTRCIEEIPFFVASNEGSILISCTTSLALGLIKSHEKLDHPLPQGNRNVIYSSADKIKRKDESQLNVHMLSRKPKLKTSNEEAPIVCSSDEQSYNTTCTRENETRTIKLINVICSQWSPKWIHSQMDQQC